MNAHLLLNSLALLQAQVDLPIESNNTMVVWGIALIGIAVALFLVELLVPSGGMIGVISVISLLSGIVMLFLVDTTWGLVGAALTLLALPFTISFAIKIWPHTPLGRALTLGHQKSSWNDAEASAATNNQQASVGRRGQALTDLHPVGTCLIDGRREECLAEVGTIDAGSPIEVITVDGMQIKVRQAS